MRYAIQSGDLIISDLGPAFPSKMGGRRRCEHYPTIDIRSHHQRKLVTQLGTRISWRWNRDGRPHCYVDLEFYYDHVILSDVTDPTTRSAISIQLLRTPCHFGGTRLWFKCPGCRRRCAKLYFCDGSFRCRRCHELGYASQLVASVDRPRLIAQRIRRSLGGSSNLTVPFPTKPPKMLWRVYYRLRDKGERFEAKAWARVGSSLR